MAGVIGTIFELKRADAKARSNAEQSGALAKDGPFMCFAARVYEKLSKLQDCIPESKQLRAEMERIIALESAPS